MAERLITYYEVGKIYRFIQLVNGISPDSFQFIGAISDKPNGHAWLHRLKTVTVIELRCVCNSALDVQVDSEPESTISFGCNFKDSKGNNWFMTCPDPLRLLPNTISVIMAYPAYADTPDDYRVSEFLEYDAFMEHLNNVIDNHNVENDEALIRSMEFRSYLKATVDPSVLPSGFGKAVTAAAFHQ